MSNMLNLALPFNAMKQKGPEVLVTSKPLVIPNYSFFDEHPQGDFINLTFELNYHD